jgi:hypothetical protein
MSASLRKRLSRSNAANVEWANSRLGIGAFVAVSQTRIVGLVERRLGGELCNFPVIFLAQSAARGLVQGHYFAILSGKTVWA